MYELDNLILSAIDDDARRGEPLDRSSVGIYVARHRSGRKEQVIYN